MDLHWNFCDSRNDDSEKLLHTYSCAYHHIYAKDLDINHSDSQFVCWVGSGYGKERLAGEYFWLWLALFVSLVTYVPLALWRRGNLVIDAEKWWKMSFRWRRTSLPGESKETRSRSSIALLAYVSKFILLLYRNGLRQNIAKLSGGLFCHRLTDQCRSLDYFQ